MQIALSYHQGDKDQADRWLAWVAELGGVNRHQLFIMPAKGAGPVDAHAAAWNRAEFIPDSYGVVSNWNASDPIRDASGPNSMFRQFAWFFMARAKGPWMFIEPDAIPMRSTWADELEAAYIRSGKPYMGAIIPGVTNEYATHATGNGVYPETAAYNEGLMIPQYAKWGQTTIEIAFDVASAKAVLNQFASTPLIQQIFRGEPFNSEADLTRIRPETAVFHNDKSGGLIRLLREKRNGTILNDTVMAIAAPEMPAESVFPSGMGEVVNKTLLACHIPSAPLVNTFCSWSSDPEYRSEQEKVLELWKQNWTDAGWEPRVLTEDDARKHPEYERFRKGFASLPIKNPMEYEMACFMRWVAMATLVGQSSVFMVDYDVINNGFQPVSDKRHLHLLCNHVPCAVLGAPWQFKEWAEQFIVDHAQSDMNCFEKHVGSGNPSFDQTCKEYGTPDWQSAKLIHFAHYACRPRKRSEVMAEWMNNMKSKEPGLISFGDLMKIGDVMRQLKESNEPSLHEQLEGSVEITQDVKYHVASLVEHSKKDGFAKGRVIQALRRAGFVPEKSKKAKLCKAK